MKKLLFNPIINGFVAVVLSVSITSCASIFSGGPKKITINTTPPGAKVTIYDKFGKVVTTRQSPTVVPLERKVGYFAPQEYRVVIEKPGYKPTEIRLQSTINGWYFGNLFLGGVIGMVIVDPMTGAMFTFSPDHINETLTPAQRSSLKKGPGLGIMLKQELSPEQVQHLKRLATDQ